LKRLDSRFHGNDENEHFQPFYETINLDGFVKRRISIKFVIPAKAGIQVFQDVLDPGFRRGDASTSSLRAGWFGFFLFFLPEVEIHEKELIDAKMDKWQEISEIPPRPPLRKRDGGISGVVGIGKMP